MTTDTEIILPNARNQLNELGEAVENLATTYPDVFDDTSIGSRLKSFRICHREAVDRLQAPSLSIAMIGTTSSGKSTIVNALIGRKIAPIEAGEMSGGVLTLRHAHERKLIVEETEGSAWETGVWSDLGDEALYEKIRDGVMRPYHDTREKRDCMAPRVTAYIPLLPASDENLLGLPQGVGVEFIDLPGLKSIQDRDNIKVIQEKVHKAFSVVALDYLQVDDKHRKRLLEELKKVVEYLQGRTDSMIFILNRVEAETMLITDVATQGWAIATATEAYLLLEDGQIDEAQQLLALEVPKFKNLVLQWSDSLIADERNQLKTAYRFTAPHFKQYISNERVERIVYISSVDNS